MASCFATQKNNATFCLSTLRLIYVVLFIILIFKRYKEMILSKNGFKGSLIQFLQLQHLGWELIMSWSDLFYIMICLRHLTCMFNNLVEQEEENRRAFASCFLNPLMLQFQNFLPIKTDNCSYFIYCWNIAIHTNVESCSWAKFLGKLLKKNAWIVIIVYTNHQTN